jgi:cob(I)alamin adenosyltransferase
MPTGTLALFRERTDMHLYTGTGDSGETSLIDGSRVAKDDIRVSAYGTVDELNSFLGWCRAVCGDPISGRIIEIQRQLLGIGSELATPPATGARPYRDAVGQETWRRLESWIDESQQVTGPQHHFVLPGGVEAACRLDIARTCCRRAERCVITLNGLSRVRGDVIIYLNRLSDLLYAWARLANHQAGRPEIAWGANT